MWSLCVWKENSRVIEDVVPHSWIEAGVLRWPPKGFSGKKAMNKRIPPSDDWLSFPILKIKLTHEDKTECMTCEYTSQDEGVKEKEKNINEIEFQEVGIDLPVFHDDTSFKRFGNNNTSHRKRKTHSISDSDNCDNSTLESPILSKASKQKSAIINAELFPSDDLIQAPSITYPISNASFQQRVLAFQEKVVKWMRDISNNLSLPTPSIAQQTTVSLFDIECVKSKEEFFLFEENMKVDSFVEEKIVQLKQIGGLDYKDTIKNIMKRFFADFAMREMNMNGTGGQNKVAFGGTETYKTIYKVVMLKFPKMTEKEFYQVVQSLLRNAPARSKKKAVI